MSAGGAEKAFGLALEFSWDFVARSRGDRSYRLLSIRSIELGKLSRQGSLDRTLV